MSEDGRLTDVIIEESITGLDVWADPGMKETIRSVPGVEWCGTLGSDVKYCVHLDPRYDVDWVIKEIEAVVKCARTEKD